MAETDNLIPLQFTEEDVAFYSRRSNSAKGESNNRNNNNNINDNDDNNNNNVGRDRSASQMGIRDRSGSIQRSGGHTRVRTDSQDDGYPTRNRVKSLTKKPEMELGGVSIEVNDAFAITEDQEEKNNAINSMLHKVLHEKLKQNILNVAEFNMKGEFHFFQISMRDFLTKITKIANENDLEHKNAGSSINNKEPIKRQINSSQSSNNISSGSSSSSNVKPFSGNTDAAVMRNTSSDDLNHNESKKILHNSANNNKKSILGIKNRDLRRLEHHYNETGDPTLLVRRHCVLFSIEPIRCIILHNKCYVIQPPGGGDSALELFSRHLNDWGNDVCFEARAYEAVLKTSHGISDLVLDEYEKEVDSILGVFKIASVIPLEKQEEMREMKDKVNQMMTQTNAIKSALDEILEDEDDLALLNLSVLKQKPYLYSLPLVDQILILKEEMEVLLESYLMEFNTITNKLNILQQKLKSAEESVSLRLDTSRNQLLIADTCVSVISLCIALGSYVGSIFGMNLSNHVETDPAMFSHVAVFTTFAITIIAIAVLYMFKSRGILPSDMTKYDVIQKYKGGFNTVKNKVQRYI